MKILQPVQLPANHNIFFFGDKHDGSVLSSDKGWDKMLNIMCSECEGVPASANYGVDMGDPIEAIMADDPRFSPEKLTEARPLEQMKMAVKRRDPIKEQLLAMLSGNHDRKLWRFGDLVAEMCEKLDVPYGTYTAKITVNDSKENLMYKTYATHGFRGISSVADDPLRQKSNMKLALKRHLKRKAADCAVMVKGHAHKLLVSEPDQDLYLFDDGKRIKQGYTSWGQTEQFIHPDARWYGCAGSFLRLFGDGISGYAEIFELDPTELGFLILKVRNKKIVALEPYVLNV